MPSSGPADEDAEAQRGSGAFPQSRGWLAGRPGCERTQPMRPVPQSALCDLLREGQVSPDPKAFLCVGKGCLGLCRLLRQDTIDRATFKRQTLISRSSTRRKSKMKAPVSGETRFLFTDAPSRCVLTCWGGHGALWGLSYKETEPFLGGAVTSQRPYRQHPTGHMASACGLVRGHRRAVHSIEH